MGDRCGHIYADLRMCQNRQLYANSTNCKRHFKDIDAGSRASDIQIQRLKKLRKIITQLTEVGYSVTEFDYK